MYIRKTTDTWEIQGLTECGWECETTETTKKDAIKQARIYRENCPSYQIRIIKKRIKL